MKVLVPILCTLGLFAALAVSIPTSKTNGKRVVCYFGSWAVYRYGHSKITADDIDCSLCTHFIYTFVGLDESSGNIVYLDGYNDVGDNWKAGLIPTIQKKCHASGTKFMVAIGGWNEGSTKYSKVMSDPVKRDTLQNSIISFVKKHNLDGFDLDWEYPGQRGGAAYDKENLALFLDALYPRFVENGWDLSAAVTANAQQIGDSYNVKHLSDHLSFINVMAYDLHGSWDATAGHHTALYASSTDAPDAKHLNVDAAILKWLELGAASDKLNLGLGTYGRSMTLVDSNEYKIGSAIGGLAPCGWIPENGFYPYNEICFNNKTVWTTEWDDIQKVPFAHSGNKWVGYDDPASIKIKTQYAKSKNLGGIMYWSIETDDFKGICNTGKYPLVQAGIEALSSDDASTEQEAITTETVTTVTESEAPAVPNETQAPETEAPATETPATETPETEAPATETPATETPETEAPATDLTTENPTIASQCETEGQLLKDPSNCSQFLVCLRNANGDLTVLPMKCSNNLVFDPSIKGCNYRSAYNSC